MRWIDKDEVEECLNEKWRTKSKQALDDLLKASTPEDRKKILTKSAIIWRDFYKLLPQALQDKCWYCEAKEIRSDTPVDHFRPKGAIEEDKNHEGYWWLAFDWENYRVACTYCNSKRTFEDSQGGKGCQFPITNSDCRACCPSDNHEQEIPAFLDPFDPDDWKLLWFDHDGIPIATPETTEEEQQKVQNSIKIFHLDQRKICQKRNRIRLNIEKEIINLKQAEKNSDKQTIQASKSTLRRMVKDTEEFSRAAIVYLRQHRNLSAVKDILQLD
ncbi:MAG: hypothetical protein HAW67_06750 [Endozoicomonadaceae bacterium]|nr:hypothetical protein [Endozoicomonadaceae bacterium]